MLLWSVSPVLAFFIERLASGRAISRRLVRVLPRFRVRAECSAAPLHRIVCLAANPISTKQLYCATHLPSPLATCSAPQGPCVVVHVSLAGGLPAWRALHGGALRAHAHHPPLQLDHRGRHLADLPRHRRGGSCGLWPLFAVALCSAPLDTGTCFPLAACSCAVPLPAAGPVR